MFFWNTVYIYTVIQKKVHPFAITKSDVD